MIVLSGQNSQSIFGLPLPLTARRHAPGHILSGKDKEPFASLLKGCAGCDEHAILQIVTVTRPGTPSVEFEEIVHDWITTATHPQTDRLYAGTIYQPMLELLGFLRGNGFEAFVASGGGIDFMRVFAERVCDIPPNESSAAEASWISSRTMASSYSLSSPNRILTTTMAGEPVQIQIGIGGRRLRLSVISRATWKCSNGPRQGRRALRLARSAYRR